MNEYLNIKNITHNDLDGIGCALLSKITFCNPYIVYSDYRNINNILIDIIQNLEYEDYDKIIVTDICCNEEVAQAIDTINKKYLKEKNIIKFEIIDHHHTAIELNKYLGFNITEEKTVDNKNILMSGTKLYYDFLKENKFFFPEIINEFVELVRSYDTWDWKKEDNIQALDLNNLFYLKGTKLFLENEIQNLKNNIIFNKTDNLFLKLDKNKKDIYFELKKKDIIFKTIDEIKFGIVFGENYISELCDYLERECDVDGIICIGPNTVSYRTQKDDIDVSKIAQKYGGGGHIKASGSRISPEQKNYLIDYLFSL